jgi:hypothetical protein
LVTPRKVNDADIFAFPFIPPHQPWVDWLANCGTVKNRRIPPAILNRVIARLRQLLKLRHDIIPPKVEQQEQEPRLIGNRFTAAIGVVLTGYVAALSLRAAFWQSPHHFHWLLPLNALLSARLTLAVNVVLYASLLWLCVVFPRSLRGKERVLVAGWVPGVLLSPIQRMVSASLAAVIQYVKAASIMIAFFAAVAILLEGPVSGSAPPEGTVPE